MQIVHLILTIMLASLLGAGVSAAETPKSGGTLTFAVTAEAPSTDCHAITTYAAVHVLAPHYSLLLKVDQDNYPKLKPDIAESWSVSPDALTYTFKIRAGVVFHDGSPLTSKDVKATFDRIRNPPAGIVSIRKELFADIASIDAPDPATVVMKIKEPDASHEWAAAHHGLGGEIRVLGQLGGAVDAVVGHSSGTKTGRTGSASASTGTGTRASPTSMASAPSSSSRRRW